MKTFVTLFLFLTFSLFSQMEIKMATVAPEGTPWANELNSIKKRVESESNNSIKIKTYINGSAGGEKEIFQSIRKGRIQGGGLTAASIATHIPEMDIFEIPYLFDSYKQADCVLDNYLLEPVKQLFDEKGLVFVSWAENGFRNIGTGSKEIRTPEDLKGIKMRSQESRIHLEFWKKLGASPIPISFHEVLPSLQTGVVDGFDQTILMTLAAEWNTEIKYYSITEHIYQPAVVIYGKKFYETLNPDQRKIILGKINSMAIKSRQEVRSTSLKMMKVLEEKSVQITRLTELEKAAFKNISSGIGDFMFGKNLGKSSLLYSKIKKGKLACTK